MGRGFLILIPLLITLLIVRYVIAAINGVFRPFVGVFVNRSFINELPASTPLTWLVLSILTLAFFYLIGVLVTGGRGQNRVVEFQNAILSRIPVVKTIYGVAHEATEALSAQREQAFSRVVFLDWPRPGVRAMGFVTGQCMLPGDDRTMLVVYIATVPNPTSGMLAIVPEEEVIEAEITVEDAMKIVFSGGIVLPDAMQLDKRVTIQSVDKSTPPSHDEPLPAVVAEEREESPSLPV